MSEAREESSASSADDAATLSETPLATLIVALLMLFRQTWQDRLSLVRAEAALAVKSLLLIVVLLCALGLLLVVTWVLILLTLAYFFLQMNVHWAIVAGFLILAQVLAGGWLWKQVRYLSEWVSFPATREAFSALEDEPPEEPTQYASEAASADAHNKASQDKVE